MEALKKQVSNSTENYKPAECPEVVKVVEKMAEEKKFATYENIEYLIDIIELPETLKFAGVTSKNNPNFQNIDKYHRKFKEMMADRHSPYTEIGFSGNIINSNFDYIFGCQVDALDNLPEGLIGADTGVKKFAVITFRSNSAYELVGGSDGPGDGMKTAGKYIREVWFPENKDKVDIIDEKHFGICVKNVDKEYITGMIEVYKSQISDDPEMCFYIPLI